MTRREAPTQLRPLIVGAGGLVGRRLSDHFENRHPHTVSATRAELDVTDRWRIESELERLEPNLVINAAAIADVDRCEREPDLAHRVNAEGPAHLAAACRNAGVRLIHLSTDYVFDGQKGDEYDESDAPHPINVYGQSKLLGEMAVLETLVDAVVLRVSFLFGVGRKTFLDRLIGQAHRQSGPIEVVDSWVNKPTSTTEIARLVERIAGEDMTGLWHLANPPALSKAEFARQLLTLIGENPGRVVPVPPHTLELDARRPPATSLSTAQLEARLGEEMKDWLACAREYLGMDA
ncbi:MAG: dTDP-4-dehydrorhamnose reductase [Acidobacteriota bacterium]|nr:MAG: dTDP-4-dehydrorhamnose reductase [Acidobacteriota bacterium]